MLLSIVNLIVGILSLVLFLARIKINPKGTIKEKKYNKYLLIFVYVVLIVILFVEINFFAYKSDKVWDLTKNKQHTLSLQTKDLIEELHEDIKITSFYVGIPPKYLEDLLNGYERQSKGSIQAEIIDPIVQIGYASKFGNVIDGKQNKAIIESGSKRVDVDFTESLLTENDINNAVSRVLRKEHTLYFLTGHGEYNIFDEGDQGLSYLAERLLDNNIISKRLLLAVENKIPDDCDVLVVPGPRNHLSAEEENIIKEYLEQGGDALFLIEHTMVTSPEKPLTQEQLDKNPSLNKILHPWNIQIENDIVVDISSHASGDVGSPATHNYMSHRDIVNNLDYTFYIRPRSISIVKDRDKSIKISPLVLTESSQNSWAEKNRVFDEAQGIKYDEGIDRTGPIPIAFIMYKPKKSEAHTGTRIIVFTDADFISNQYIKHYSNAQMAVKCVDWLAELDYKFYMDQGDIKVSRLDLTSKQKRMVVVILVLMPAFIAFFGMLIWLKQKINPIETNNDG